MTKKIKYLFYGIGFFICLGFLLTGAVLFFVNTPHAGQFIQNKINAAIPGQLTWAHHHLSILKGRMEISNFSIADPSGVEVITVDRMVLDMNWLPLVKMEIAIDEILLEKPSVRLAVLENGRLNVAAAFSHGEKVETEAPRPEHDKGFTFPFNVRIHSLTVSEGFASYLHTAQDMDIWIDPIDATVEADWFAQKTNIFLECGKGQINLKGVNTPLDRFHLDGFYEKGRIVLSDLTASTPAATATIKGHARDIFHTPLVDVTLAVFTDLPELEKVFSLQPNFTGKATAHLSVKGPVTNPSGHLVLTHEGGEFYSFPVDGIEMDLVLNDRIAVINYLRVPAATGESQLTGEIDFRKTFPDGFLGSALDMDQLAYTLALKQQNLKPGAFFKIENTFEGDVSTRFDISGKGVIPEKLSAKATFFLLAENFTSGVLQESGQITINGRVEMEQNKVSVQELKASSKGVDLWAAGTMDLETQSLDANMDAKSLDIHPLLSALGIANSQGGFSLNARISGPMAHPDANLSFSTHALTAADIHLGDARITANMTTDGILHISELTVRNQGATLYGSGSLHLFKTEASKELTPPLPFTADFKNMQPEFFIKDFGLKGKFNGRFTVDRVLDTPEATLVFQGEHMAWHDVSIGALTSHITLAQGLVTVKQMDLENKTSKIQAKGQTRIFEGMSYHLVPRPYVNIDIQSKVLRLADFINDGKGVFSLDTQIQGTYQNLNGHLKMKGDKITLFEQPFSSVDLNAQFAGDKIHIRPLDIFLTPAEVLHLEGFISGKGDYDLAFKAEAISLKNILPGKRPDRVNAKISAALEGRGSFDDPGVNGRIVLSGVTVEGKEMPDMRMEGVLNNQQADIAGLLPFMVQATYHLSDKTFSVQARFEQSDLKPYFAVLNQPDFSGHITGTADVSGTTDNISATTGKIHLPEVNILFHEKPVISSHDLDISIENQVASINSFHLLFPDDGNLSVHGIIPLHDRLALKSKGNIPLSIFGLFRHDLNDMSGNLIFDAEVTGKHTAPSVNGKIDVQNLEATIPVLFQKLHNTQANITLTPETLTIVSLTGQLDEGRFEVTGRLDLENFSPTRVQGAFTAHQLPILVPDTLDLVLNADLKLTGDANKSLVDGNLVLIEGLYYKDVNLNPLTGLGPRKRPAASGPAKPRSPFLSNMALDISVKGRNPLVVDNNMAQMEILPDLEVRGTAAHPVINGRTSVRSGYIEYRKRVFEIQRGVIDFINPYQTEALLDIMGTSRIRDWLVALSVSGTPDELVFKLTSNPPLEDGDILSLLILGRTSGEVASGEGGANLSAAQMLSQLMGDRLNEDIRKTTGLDIFQAEMAQENGDSGGDSLKVTLGKALSKRMTLKYAAQTENGEIVQRTIAEYKALENILLNIFQGSQGNFGGAVKYRLEFR